jgi:murein DD-endopeptidase MepM/ murein hydrolase activator NlpD
VALLLAHLQQGSVKVAAGSRVQRGDELARCGSSGNSTEPHLHLQAQRRPYFDANADLETLPIRFVGISRKRRGVVAEGSFFVRRNDVFDPLGKPQK